MNNFSCGSYKIHHKHTQKKRGYYISVITYVLILLYKYLSSTHSKSLLAPKIRHFAYQGPFLFLSMLDAAQFWRHYYCTLFLSSKGRLKLRGDKNAK